jgi:S-adenosylmethionine decarboxylase proenzyme
VSNSFSYEDGYVVRVSKQFVVLCLLSSIFVAFAVGRVARVMMVNGISNMDTSNASLSSSFIMSSLPDPILKLGKVVPTTEYTSKTFDTAKATSSQSRWVVVQDANKQEQQEQQDQCSNLSEEGECSASQKSSVSLKTKDSKEGSSSGVNETDDDEDDDGHIPAGQHLLIDIENVDEVFLNSEERLVHAMIKLVDECDLTMLSYHCHKLHPSGVSCAGILLESHVSFHTWPKQGVITLDLFTCGPNSLLPMVPLVEKLFAVPLDPEISRKEGKERVMPNMVWAQKIRGFDFSSDDVAEMTDLQWFPVGRMTDYKKEVSSGIACIQSSCFFFSLCFFFAVHSDSHR